MIAFYNILDIIWQYLSNFTFHLFVLELIIVRHYTPKNNFALRYVPAFLILTLLTAFPKDAFYKLSFFQIGWYNFSYIFIFSASILVLLFSFKTTPIKIIFHATIAYNIQHLTAISSTLICNFFIPDFNRANLFHKIIRSPVTTLIYIIIFALVIRNIPLHDKQEFKNIALLLFSSCSLFIINILSCLRMKNSGGYLLLLYDVVCSSFLLAIQAGLFQIKQLSLEKEITFQILHEVQKQTERSKTEIDLINQKCHDLKHQLLAMERLDDQKLQQRNTEEINSLISKYDSYSKTGNTYLDAVLSEKGLLCVEKNIHFTYIIPAKHLNFMDPVDIFSLFGNALDNAIEAVEMEPEDHRIITVHSVLRGNLLNIRIENYCSRLLSFENGLPISTKENNGYHGFGTKSIGLIVEKYKGEYSMSQLGDRFILSLLFSAT